ncbi:MAG: hypothetical protein FVQ81_02095 [Candidatus Glassbacteria bacterium]|nr:hypothetical protein [Candidatus Glassbacteria bacterium]
MGTEQLPGQTYEYVKYPAVRYHATEAPRTITSEAQEEKGWHDSPVKAAADLQKIQQKASDAAVKEKEAARKERAAAPPPDSDPDDTLPDPEEVTAEDLAQSAENFGVDIEGLTDEEAVAKVKAHIEENFDLSDGQVIDVVKTAGRYGVDIDGLTEDDAILKIVAYLEKRPETTPLNGDVPPEGGAVDTDKNESEPPSADGEQAPGPEIVDTPGPAVVIPSKSAVVKMKHADLYELAGKLLILLPSDPNAITRGEMITSILKIKEK